MKKKTVGAAAKESAAQHLAAIESAVFSKLHALVAHCAITKYDDGDVRRPGWFTIKTLGSSWVVQVKDPDSCMQMSAIATTLDDALALAQLLLESEEAPWEPDPFLKRAPARKAG